MGQAKLLVSDAEDFISVKDAVTWASNYLNRPVTSANISYLIQYGRINKYNQNGSPRLSIKELMQYYADSNLTLQKKKQLADDVNWNLSFSQYKEAETTKHVHRLHPYKGKFIPQLVEYFLDDKTDDYKNQTCFHKGDIILDPFCGSGTTLVQSNELGFHSIGIDVSAFNAMMSNAKIAKYQLPELKDATQKISTSLNKFQMNKKYLAFEIDLTKIVAEYNRKYFPSPAYKIKLLNKEINEKDYAADKEKKLLDDYKNLVKQYGIRIIQQDQETFLGKWFVEPVHGEINFVFNEIKQIKNIRLKKILAIILSRTIRSCRATTHADLGTLKNPVTSPYYCKKHGKLCRPIFSINNWWQRYSIDTIRRLDEFDKLRTDTQQICLAQDSRKVNVIKELQKKKHPLAAILQKQKIKGIFSSPPYVGLIDYHQQHAYSYEMFGFERKDDLEIGPLFMGQGIKARESYKQGVAAVLSNCKKFMQDDFDVFLVANDKYNLYPEIASIAAMRIVKTYKRPVLNRVEKDRHSAYYETIFHLKQQA